MAIAWNPAVAISLGTSAVVTFVGPAALFWFVWKRLGASPRGWLWGALTFFVSQIVLRFPWQLPLNHALGPLMKEDPRVLVAWLLCSALTAGLFEEWGRFVAYRFAWKDRSVPGALMLGAGHGGFEAMLLVGVNLVATTALYVALSHGLTLGLPAEAVAAVEAPLATVTPALALMGGLERLSAMALHLGCSLLVLQGVNSGQRRCVWASVAAHASLNFAAVALTRWANPFVAEAVLLAGAAALLWASVRYALKARELSTTAR